MVAFHLSTAYSQPATVPVNLGHYQQVRYVSAMTGSDESGDGSVAAPWKTLSFALSKAADASTSKAYAILIASGSYTGSGDTAFTMKPWVDLYGGYDSTTWTRNIDLNRTILDGQGERRVMEGASTSRIDGLTLRNGVTPWGQAGGGIRFQSTSYSTVSNCTITLNSSSGVWSDFSILTLEDNSIAANTSSSGGGIYVKRSAFTMNGCRLSSNTASGNGGAAAFSQTSSARLTGCTIDFNTSGRSGGGVFSEGTSTILGGCTLTANSASEDGGGIRADYSPLRLTQCIITENAAGGSGGGIFCFSNSHSQLTNCLLAHNSARDAGGALHCSTSSQTWVNCTLVSNTASDAAALQCSQSTVLISNSILWNPGNEVVVSGDPMPTIRYSCVQGGWAGTGNVSAYALFLSPLDGDYHLKDGSPCIDSASQTLAPTSDLEGTARPGGDAKVDMGAYEMPDAFAPGVNPVPERYYVSNSVQTSGDGTSWVKAFKWIGEALIAAEARMQVWVAQGTYHESITLEKNVLLYGGFAGDELSLSARNPELHPTVIDAKGKHIRTVTGADGVVIDGFTLTGGSARTGGGLYLSNVSSATVARCVIQDNTAADSGGGVYARKASVVIEKCLFAHNRTHSEYGGMGGGGLFLSEGSSSRIIDTTFSSNSTYREGGGIFCTDSSLELDRLVFSLNEAHEQGGGVSFYNSSGILSQCVFEANQCVKGDGWYGNGGGGMYCEYTSPVVDSCTFSYNQAAQNGGGFMSLEDSIPVFRNCVFEGNAAGDRGGGWSSTSASPELTDCIFRDNTAGGNGGGALLLGDNGTLLRCSFLGNMAGTSGGGLHCYSASPTIIDCTLTGNTSQGSGGGLTIYDGNSAPTIRDCRITRNLAIGYGGGVYCAESVTPGFSNCLIADNVGYGVYCYFNADSNLVNCTVASNRGGGIYSFWSDPKVVNSILWNPGEEAFDPYNSPSWKVTITHSCVQGGHTGEGNKNALPLFRDKDHGDYRLTNGSPCVDSGLLSASPPADLEGRPRPGADGQVDMGAYEADESFIAGSPVAATRLYVVAGAAEGGSGLTWTDPLPFVNSALVLVSSPAEIWVASGTYRESLILETGARLYGGLAGFETDLSQRQTATHHTVIDATGTGKNVATMAEHAVLDELVLRGGSANSGGGVYFPYISSATINGCTIHANQAAYGGGICFRRSSPFLTRCTLAGNEAENGGGVFIHDESYPVFVDCRVEGNAASTGGGVYCGQDCDCGMSRCAVRGNSSHGFCVMNRGYFALENCLISENSGFGLYADSGDAKLINCTLAGNHQGGIRTYASGIQVTNCIAWNRNAEFDLGFAGNPYVTDSCIQGGWPGPRNIGFLPGFVDPDKGDFRLADGSPCIGSASATVAPGTDIEGNPRPGGNGSFDIGAFEAPDSFQPGPAAGPTRLYVSAAAPAGGNGLSWAAPLRTIEEALRQTSIGTEVWVAAGTYPEAVSLDGTVKLFGGFAGDEVSLLQRDWMAHPVIMDATGNGTRVIRLADKVTLDGFTITGGDANEGAGIYLYSVNSATISNCWVTHNRAWNDGGGLNATESAGVVTHCTFTENQAYRGGGAFVSQAFIQFAHCSLSSNSVGYSGGGVFSHYDQSTWTNCRILGNSAMGEYGVGGGLFFYFSYPQIANSIIAWNSSRETGGALGCELGSHLWFGNCTIYGNSSGSGGAVSIFQSAVTGLNSILWGNTPREISGDLTSLYLSHCDVQGGATGLENIDVDPMLTAPSSGDFHLLEASPCRGKGDWPAGGWDVLRYDIDGDPRSGATCDIGADEYHIPTWIQEWPDY